MTSVRNWLLLGLFVSSRALAATINVVVNGTASHVVPTTLCKSVCVAIRGQRS